MRWLPMCLVLAACGPPTPAAELGGCGADRDCKGERICVQRSCVDPPRSTAPQPSSAPAPSTAAQRDASPAISPPPEPAPSAQPADDEPPPDTVSSGQRPPERCGCAVGDVLCKMRCAQKGNAAGPSTFPDHRPAPNPPSPDGAPEGAVVKP